MSLGSRPRRKRRSAFIGGLLLLAVGCLALSLRPIWTWASLESTASQGDATTIAPFHFSPDAHLVARVDGGTVELLDVATNARRLVDLGTETDRVIAIAFDASSSALAVSRQTGRITLWNLRSATQGAELTGHDGQAARAIAFSASGKRLASGGDDGRMVLWDTQSGRQLASLVASRRPVAVIAFSSDGRAIAGGGDEAPVVLWDLELGRRQTLREGADAQPCATLFFSRDGAMLTHVSRDGNVLTWSRSGVMLQTFSATKGAGITVARNTDGNMLAAAATDTDIDLWHVANAQKQASLRRSFGETVPQAVYSPRGDLLATFGGDTRVALWDTTTGVLGKVLTGHREWVAAVAFSPDAATLLSVGRDGQIIAWDATSGLQRYVTEIARARGAVALSPLGSLAPIGQSATPPAKVLGESGASNSAAAGAVAEANVSNRLGVGGGASTVLRKQRRGTLKWKGVTGIALSPDGSLVAAVSENGRIGLWDPATGRRIKLFSRKAAFAVSGVTFGRDGRRLLTAGRDTVLSAWDIANGRESLLHGHEQPVRALAASAAADLCASAGEDTRIMIWNLTQGRLVNVLSGHVDFVNAIAFSPDGRRLASGAADGRVLVWDVHTGTLLHTLLGHAREVNVVVYSRDGAMLASASEDRRVILWDAASYRQVGALEGHANSIRTIAFAPDGKSLVSAGEEASVIVWDVVTRKPKRLLSGATSTINGVAFSSDGLRLFTGDETNQVVQWDWIGGSRGRTFE